MESGTHEQIRILNEKGIVEKKGAGFHTPLEFASEHLFYVVWSSHYVCNRLYSVQRDYLNYYSLIYVLGGKMEIEYEGEKFVVGENEAVLLDFRKPHAYRAVSDRLDKWEMVFKGNAIDAYYELITATWGRRFKVAGRLRERICVLMETLDSPRPGDHTVSMLIHAILCGIVEQNTVKLSPAVEKALNYIYSNYEKPLQVGGIANHVSLSRYYFSRIFKKETGRSPNECLAEVRINAAKKLLSEKDFPISEIAEKCGFTNTSHFSRFFREKTGQSPASFRKAFREL